MCTVTVFLPDLGAWNSTLANAVKAMLGPKGRNVVLDKSFGAPSITKDGVSVAKEMELATTARSCRSVWPSWPAAWPSSRSVPPPKST